MKVIPHKKPKREPKPYTPLKPKRYRVEYFIYQEDRWIMRDDYRTARSAKYWARYWENNTPEYKWRVVDTRGWDTE